MLYVYPFSYAWWNKLIFAFLTHKLSMGCGQGANDKLLSPSIKLGEI